MHTHGYDFEGFLMSDMTGMCYYIGISSNVTNVISEASSSTKLGFVARFTSTALDIIYVFQWFFFFLSILYIISCLGILISPFSNYKNQGLKAPGFIHGEVQNMFQNDTIKCLILRHIMNSHLNLK